MDIDIEKLHTIRDEVLEAVRHITVSQAIGYYLLAWVAYKFAVFFYRLTFHPLAKIPGPKLAAATFLVEFYHNIPKNGTFIYKIQEWHEKYGPVVRITPDEVHLSDPEHYDSIYRVGTKFYKPSSFYHSFGIKRGSFLLSSNEEHRVRRAAIGTFFSTKSVMELQSLIHEKVDKLERRLDKTTVGEKVDLDCAFQAVSVDVITDYCYARCYNLLDEEDFGRNGYFKLNRERGTNLWVNKQFPVVPAIALSLPMGLVKYLNEAAYAILSMQRDCTMDVMNIKSNPGVIPRHKTIFHQLLDPKATENYKIPPDDVLVEEALVILGAASETTGTALGSVAWHVINDKSIYTRLKTELRSAFPDPNTNITHQSLEKLPYLNACIREGLRLGYGVPGRLPRVVPSNTAPTVFSGYTIPPGSSVSISQITLLLNPNIFPDPKKFNPDRWLIPSSDGGGVTLDLSKDKYFIPFSKGSRACIGINLAWSELYVVIGRLFRRWELEMHESASKETVYYDYFGGRLGDGEMGVQVKVLGRSE